MPKTKGNFMPTVTGGLWELLIPNPPAQVLIIDTQEAFPRF
jgi:hypothetical protein